MIDIYSMCGIAGIITPQSPLFSKERLQKMTDALAHRGPDGEGYWVNPSQHAALGHRRLAIIDLSAAASQPLHYLGRYSIVHNGEIYNYIEVKETLRREGYSFKSQSDTEVILAAYDHWKEECLQQFEGMFSFAIWDEKEHLLFAARDRMGEKPFYYSKAEGGFIFASEIKALWAAGIARQINNKRLLNYIALGWVQNPTNSSETFYEGILSLPPAHFIKFNRSDGKLQIQNYWDLTRSNQATIKETETIEKFGSLFSSAVKRRLRSDVTLGSSLSGGIDSSSIVNTILRLTSSKGNLNTFSAHFPGFVNDESSYIQLMTNQAGVENFKTVPTAETFIIDFDKLLSTHQEPFSSASLYAQYRVFELASQRGVKVLLDGQGADEILAGYHKYYHWFWQELYLTDRKLFNMEVAAARLLNIKEQWSWKNKLAAWFPEKAARLLEQRDIHKVKSNTYINKEFCRQNLDTSSIHKPEVGTLHDILYFNMRHFGLEELLRNADRNSMAHGREVRLPFLSHELVEFVFSLPSSLIIRNGWTKWCLRKSMESILPGAITWRRDKVGFEPPQKQWMENAHWQDYIHEAKKKLVSERILNREVLQKKIQPLDAHAADNFDWRFLITAGFIQ